MRKIKSRYRVWLGLPGKPGGATTCSPAAFDPGARRVEMWEHRTMAAQARPQPQTPPRSKYPAHPLPSAGSPRARTDTPPEFGRRHAPLHAGSTDHGCENRESVASRRGNGLNLLHGGDPWMNPA